MDDIFVTYIMLYIICTIENDTFDLEWIKEAYRENWEDE